MGNSPQSKDTQQKSRFPAVSGAWLGFYVVTSLSIPTNLHAGQPLRNAREAMSSLSHSQAGQSTSLHGNVKSSLGETLL